MKKTTLILLIFSLLIACESKNEGPSFSKENAHEMIKEFYQALSTGDSTLMSSVLSLQFEMYEHEVLWNEDSLLWLMGATQGRIWRVDEITFHEEGKFAHAYYYNESDKPLGRSWYESMLFKKEGDEWKIRFMHSTKRYLK